MENQQQELKQVIKNIAYIQAKVNSETSGIANLVILLEEPLTEDDVEKFAEEIDDIQSQIRSAVNELDELPQMVADIRNKNNKLPDEPNEDDNSSGKTPKYDTQGDQ